MSVDQPITLFPYPTLTTGPCDLTVVPFPLGLYRALPFHWLTILVTRMHIICQLIFLV
jgi:hypothetical protein